MLDVVTTSFYIKAPMFNKEAFERYSTELFDEWDQYVEKHLGLPDYAVTLVIEEGSIKGAARIGAAVGALYLAIGNYGSFISGVQIIREQAAHVTNALFDEANIGLVARARVEILSRAAERSTILRTSLSECSAAKSRRIKQWQRCKIGGA